MCGIAGIVALEGGDPDPARVRAMLDRLHHRGPDSEGLRLEAGAALGMTRLAIIDLVGGEQPMASEDGRAWIVLNGEIYNFRALRTELERLGHRFRTSSDTECALRAWEEWGDACVDRLRGMFSFAVWDTRTRRLFAARDRLGEKPFYWTVRGKELIFASELKAIEAATPRPPIDLAALDEYLSFGFISAPRTIYQGIHKLEPGHVLTVEGGRVTTRPYWRPRLGPVVERTVADAARELRSLLEEVVRDQLVSDVPLGAFLSGGLDSSTIVALMTRVSSAPVRTFCVGFEEAEFDERPYARRVAAHLGTVHEEAVLRPDIAADLPRLVRHFDEPFGDKSLVPTYYVAQMARRHVKVALSGDGGDEVFGGYLSYLSTLARLHRAARRPRLFERAVRLLAPRWPQRLPRAFSIHKRAFPPLRRFVAASFVFDPDAKRSLYSQALAQALASVDPMTAKARHAEEPPADRVVAGMQLCDLRHYLPDDVLAKVDRMTMACSLESRAPFLDHRVVELGLGLPDRLKIDGEASKLTLRALAADLLPAEILARPKRGFALPVKAWLTRPLKQLASDVVTSDAVRGSGWFDAAAISRLVGQLGQERAQIGTRLWLLLCLGLWLQR